MPYKPRHVRRRSRAVIGVVVALCIAVGVLAWRTTTTTVRTVTVPAPTTTTTTVAPSKADAPDEMRVTTKPVAVPGGTFTVTGANATLYRPVVRSDSFYTIVAWFGAMGGGTALARLENSPDGRDPQLVKPGDTLTVTVPTADIPHYSPVWLADT